MWLCISKLIPISLACFLVIHASNGVRAEDPSEALHREKRKALAYPINSCTGVLVAVAYPLNLPNRNVFVSYNFEANYNMPTTATDIVPGPLNRLDYLVDKERSFTGANRTNSVVAKEKTDSIISRAKIYKLIESKISGLNLNGKKCMLRLICDSANETEESLYKHNGVIGDLLKILLTPSSTSVEGSPEYFEAEEVGRKGDCGVYRNGCGVNLLNYFSSVL